MIMEFGLKGTTTDFLTQHPLRDDNLQLPLLTSASSRVVPTQITMAQPYHQGNTYHTAIIKSPVQVSAEIL